MQYSFAIKTLRGLTCNKHRNSLETDNDRTKKIEQNDKNVTKWNDSYHALPNICDEILGSEIDLNSVKTGMPIQIARK